MPLFALTAVSCVVTFLVQQHGGAVEYYRPEREAQVLRGVVARNKGPLTNEEMVRLFDCRGLGSDFETYSFHMLEEVAAKGFLAEDAAFIDSILNGTEPMVSALDGYRAVELVESVYGSIRTGERIKFE